MLSSIIKMGSNHSATSIPGASIATITSQHDIVVFQSAGCPYCSDAIDKLTSAGYEPSVIEATGEQRTELRSLTSSSSVPSIWIKGKFVGGCNDGPEAWMGISKILRNYKMDDLLKGEK